jgi:hypothetical protein
MRRLDRRHAARTNALRHGGIDLRRVKLDQTGLDGPEAGSLLPCGWWSLGRSQPGAKALAQLLAVSMVRWSLSATMRTVGQPCGDHALGTQGSAIAGAQTLDRQRTMRGEKARLDRP